MRKDRGEPFLLGERPQIPKHSLALLIESSELALAIIYRVGKIIISSGGSNYFPTVITRTTSLLVHYGPIACLSYIIDTRCTYTENTYVCTESKKTVVPKSV
jgi:hypothetical protein